MKDSKETMTQLSVALLTDSLNGWAVMFRQRINDKIVEKWIEIFAHVDPRILQKALYRVTENAERMPAPGTLTKAIAASRDDIYVDLRQEQEHCMDPTCSCRDPETRKLYAGLKKSFSVLIPLRDMANFKHERELVRQMESALSEIPFRATDEDLPKELF